MTLTFHEAVLFVFAHLVLKPLWVAAPSEVALSEMRPSRVAAFFAVQRGPCAELWRVFCPLPLIPVRNGIGVRA